MVGGLFLYGCDHHSAAVAAGGPAGLPAAPAAAERVTDAGLGGARRAPDFIAAPGACSRVGVCACCAGRPTISPAFSFHSTSRQQQPRPTLRRQLRRALRSAGSRAVSSPSSRRQSARPHSSAPWSLQSVRWHRWLLTKTNQSDELHEYAMDYGYWGQLWAEHCPLSC